MHLRLDDLRKQARMLQMYERSRTRSTEGSSPMQASNTTSGSPDPRAGLGIETATSLTDSIQPID